MQETSASADAEPSQTLADALARRGISLDEPVVDKLDAYCRTLWGWNEKINLTRHTTYDKFAARDVVDSLRIAAVLAQGERVLDLGTGAGVPGVVLAIARPDLRVTLSESVGKKARAVSDMVAALGLKVAMHHGRGEELLARRKFDTVVVRAVAPLTKLLTWFKPHWNSLGRMLIVKGPQWVEERGEARHLGLFNTLELRKRDAWIMEGTESESVLLEIWPKSREPRLAGVDGG